MNSPGSPCHYCTLTLSERVEVTLNYHDPLAQNVERGTRIWRAERKEDGAALAAKTIHSGAELRVQRARLADLRAEVEVHRLVQHRLPTFAQFGVPLLGLHEDPDEPLNLSLYFPQQQQNLREYLDDNLIRFESEGAEPQHGPHHRLVCADRWALAGATLNAVAGFHAAFAEAGLRVVHHDLKPDNLFVETVETVENAAGGVRVRIADLGSLLLQGDSVTIGGARSTWSLGYSPPEQCHSWPMDSPDPSRDVYATAVMVYEILTDELPECTNPIVPGDWIQPVPSPGRGHPVPPWCRVVRLDRLRQRLPGPDDPRLLSVMTSLFSHAWPQASPKVVAEPAAAHVAHLVQALRKALDPNPLQRSTTFELLDQSFQATTRILSQPPPAEPPPPPTPRTRWPWAMATASAVAGVALLASGRMSPEPPVRLLLHDLPDWAQAEVVVDGERVPTVIGEERQGDSTLPLFGFESLARGAHRVAVDLYYAEPIRRAPMAPGEGWTEHLDRRRCRVRLKQSVLVKWNDASPRLDVWLKEEVRQQEVIRPCLPAARALRSVLLDPPAGTRVRLAALPDEPLTDSDEHGLPDEPLTQAFLMTTTEVSQALYEKVMSENPVRFGTSPVGTSFASLDGQSLTGDDLPVVGVTFCEALMFANRLSAMEGLTPAYVVADDCPTTGAARRLPGADGWRLPTPAEWVFAARAGDAGAVYSGYYGGSDGHVALCGVANIADASRSNLDPKVAVVACADGVVALAPPARFDANAFALYDVTGNVSEWVFDADADGWARDIVHHTWTQQNGQWCHRPSASDTLNCAADPTTFCGPEAHCRMLRGGSFLDGHSGARISNRTASLPGDRHPDQGFRVVRDWVSTD